MVSLQQVHKVNRRTYLAKTFSLSMLLETESREVDTRAEDLRLCQDTDSTNTINLHLHIWVTVGVAEVGQIELAERIFAIAWRILDRRAAGRDSAIVPCVNFLRTVEIESDRPAIGVRRDLAVDRARQHEDRALPAPAGAALVVGPSRLFEQGIVELSGAIEIIRSDHDVGKHKSAPIPFALSLSKGCSSILPN